MPSVWKELLSPGTYLTDSGPVTFTARQVRTMHDSARRMLANRVSIPLPLEHQDGAKALTHDEMEHRLAAVRAAFEPAALSKRSAGEVRARTVTNNTGFAEDVRMRGDSLDVKLGVEWLPEATTPEEIKHRLENTIRYVSPRIEPVLVDGSGERYELGINHIALTPRPVYQRQQPFGAGKVPALLSLADAPEYGPAFGTVCLSLLDRLEDRTDLARPPFPPKKGKAPPDDEAESPDDVTANGIPDDDPEADEPEESADSPPDLDDTPDDVPEEATPDAAPGTPPARDWQSMGETALVQHVRQQLEEKEGICLPPSVHTAFDLASHLATILNTKHAGTQGPQRPQDDQYDTDPDLDDDPEADPADPNRKPREEPMVVSMSRTATAYDQRLATLEADNAALRRGAILTEATRLREEGRMSPARLKALSDLLADDGYCLSLARREKPADEAKIAAWLESARETPEGTYLTGDEKAVRLSRGTQPGDPPDLGKKGDELEPSVMAGLTGGRWKPPAA